MKYDVYALGHALVDVQVQVSDEVLAATGFEKGIMTLVDDDQQKLVLDQIGDLPRHHCAGGSAANTIVGLADLGGKGAFCGKIGRDAVGDAFLADMENLGVEMDVPPTDAGATGTCAVLITPDAQRTMLTHLGVSASLSAADVDEVAIRNSKYLYLEGYLLTGESGREAVERAIQLAGQHGVKVALTASDPFLVNMIRDDLWDLIKGPVDLLFCNEEEALSLTGEPSADAAARVIHEHLECVAVTLGSQGSLVLRGEAIQIAGVCVEAVDTTGAGDMYAGGLLYGITNGLSWQQSGTLASHVSARIVAQLGARLEEPVTAEQRDQIVG